MTSGYYCAIFPFCGGGKKKDDKKTKAFYDWATTGIPVITRHITTQLMISIARACVIILLCTCMMRQETNGSCLEDF